MIILIFFFLFIAMLSLKIAIIMLFVFIAFAVFGFYSYARTLNLYYLFSGMFTLLYSGSLVFGTHIGVFGEQKPKGDLVIPSGESLPMYMDRIADSELQK